MTVKELRNQYIEQVIIFKDGKNPMNKKKYVIIPKELQDKDDIIKLANSIFRVKKENLRVIDGYINNDGDKLYLKKPFFKKNKKNVTIVHDITDDKF